LRSGQGTAVDAIVQWQSTTLTINTQSIHCQQPSESC